MGQRRLRAAPALGKTDNHGGPRSEAQTYRSGCTEAHLRERRGGGHARSFWREATMPWDGGGRARHRRWRRRRTMEAARSEAETHGSGRSQVRSGRSGAPHRDPWCSIRIHGPETRFVRERKGKEKGEEERQGAREGLLDEGWRTGAVALDAGVRCKPKGENRDGETRKGGKKIEWAERC